MRTFGGLLIIAGIAGFFYCSSELQKHTPVPEETSIGRSLDYPAGRYEVGRYVAIAAAACGVVISMFPQGR